MTTREADRPLQRFVRSARPVSFATGRTYTTSRDTTNHLVNRPCQPLLSSLIPKETSLGALMAKA
jgi:hypothetical protein